MVTTSSDGTMYCSTDDGADAPDEVPVIGELLGQAEAAREEGADVVDVEYAGDGRPVRISVGWEENAIDDEEAYVISGYEVLG